MTVVTDMWSFIAVLFENAHFLCPFHFRFLVLCHILWQCPSCAWSCISESNLDKLISLVEITEDIWRLFCHLGTLTGHADIVIVLLSKTIRFRRSKALGRNLPWARQTPELGTLLALGPSPCLQEVQDVLAPAPRRDSFQVESLLISIFGLPSFGFLRRVRY